MGNFTSMLCNGKVICKEVTAGGRFDFFGTLHHGVVGKAIIRSVLR